MASEEWPATRPRPVTDCFKDSKAKCTLIYVSIKMYIKSLGCITNGVQSSAWFSFACGITVSNGSAWKSD